MNIAIVGIGKVGKSLTRYLCESDSNNVVIIDKNPEVIEYISNLYDVIGVCGNGASYSVQSEAKTNEADLLVAVTDNDEVNILACLVAKKIGVKHTIARIRDQEYEKQLRLMREDFGLSMIINPERSLAREIARLLRFPAALEVDSFSKRRIELIGYHITEDSRLNGVKLMELFGKFNAKVLACAVARGEDNVIIPSGNFTLQSEDMVYLTGDPRELEKLFRNLGVFKEKAKRVMIVGASRIGYYLSREILDAGMQVKIIERDHSICEKFAELLPKAFIVHGDGTDDELLNEEGIAEADAFVSLTDLDETNIVLAMYAAQKNVDKVVAKVNRKPFANLVMDESLIDSTVATSDVTTEIILQYIRTMQNARSTKIKTLHRILDGRAEVLEFTASKELPFLNVPFKELRFKDNVLIGGIVKKNGQIIIPNGEDSLKDGDDVLVITTNSNVEDLSEILR